VSLGHLPSTTAGGPIDEQSEPGQRPATPTDDGAATGELSQQLPQRLEQGLRIGVPALAGLVLVAYMLGETVAIDHDLRVVAPPAARPGDGLPVRAFLYGELRAVEGARLVEGELRARVLDEAGRELASQPLRAGHAGSYEGRLQLPTDARGPLRLEVRARVGEGATVAAAALHVDPGLPPRLPEPRILRALQQHAPGPVKPVGGAVAPAPLRTVVGGGGCVPEQPCTLWTHVGSPAVGLEVERSAAIFPLRQSAAETDGVLAHQIRVHGPEAVLNLTARRAGESVARRSVRLPVLLGGAALSLRPPAADGTGLALSLGGEPGSCIVDAYRDGHWVDTATVEACAEGPSAGPSAGSGPAPLSQLSALSAGVWRLQVRRDPFSSARAAVAVLHVPPSGGDDAADTLAVLAGRARGRERSDALVAQVLADPARFAKPQDAAVATRGYLAAKLEQGVIALPEAFTSYAEAQRRFVERRTRAKFVTIVALVLSGLCLGLLVARRGMAASAQARDIMARAGDPTARDQRRRLVMTLRVLGVMAAILLAFVVIALYVVARGISLN